MLTNARPVRIEWGDCDPAGIVFFPRYFAMFDASVWELFRSAGWPKPRLQTAFDMVGCPLVDTRTKFLIPSRFGDDVTIVSRIASFKRSSFEVEHKIMRGTELSVECLERRVWVGRHPDDPAGIKAQPIPEEIATIFGQEDAPLPKA